MAKVLNRDIVYDRTVAVIAIQGDSLRVSSICTKPNGSGSNYMSVGKLVTKADDFGDVETKYHHYDYPNKFEREGYKCKREYEGEYGYATSRVWWTLIIPLEMIQKGYVLARIGSGQGGRGYRSSDIEILVDKEYRDYPNFIDP